MRTLFLMLGFPDLALSQMLVIAALACACAFALAWIADAILGEGAFGVLMNTSILIVGAALGTLIWRKLGYSSFMNLPQTLAIVALGSGLAALIVCGVMRRWI